MKRKRKRRRLTRKSARELALTQVNGKKNAQSLHLVKHGAYKLQHGYYSGKLDRRTSLGQIVAQMEEEFATHMGYEDFNSSPITLREKIRLLVGNWLFQSFFVASDGTAKTLRASENMTNRILTELGLVPTSRPISLESYLEEKKTRHKATG